LTDEDYGTISRRGTPQPYKTFTSKLSLEHDAPRGVRRAAIFCTEGGMNVEAIRSLLERQDPRAMMFAGDDWELFELPTGHWAMFTEPAMSAALLAQIAEA
jgi:hypothetical protein